MITLTFRSTVVRNPYIFASGVVLGLLVFLLGVIAGERSADKVWRTKVAKHATALSAALTEQANVQEAAIRSREAELTKKASELEAAKAAFEQMRVDLIKGSQSVSANEARWQQRLLDAGFAEYHPKTGKWRLLNLEDVALTAIVLGHGKLSTSTEK